LTVPTIARTLFPASISGLKAIVSSVGYPYSFIVALPLYG
jgi:hypothetical protein